MSVAIQVVGVGYIFCFIFLAGLIVLVIMMCLNEFKRFLGYRKKKNGAIDRNLKE